MRAVFVVAVCAILTLSFFIACDRSPTKFDDPPDPYPDTWFPPDILLTPTDTIALVTVLDWLKVHGAEYGITAPTSQLRFVYVDSDTTARATVNLGQVYHGLSVFHKRAGFQIYTPDRVYVAWMTFDPDVSLDVSVTPSFTKAAAIEKFLASQPDEMGFTEVHDSELMIYPRRIEDRLVWWLYTNSTNSDRAAEVLYDVHTGVMVYGHYFRKP